VIRDAAVRSKEAQKAQAQEQQAQQQQQQMMQNANIERMELQKQKEQGIELSEAQKDRMAKLDAIILRGKVKMEVDQHKHGLTMDQMSKEQKE
jgi:hypothetical protein